jgi:hypothetical protein
VPPTALLPSASASFPYCAGPSLRPPEPRSLRRPPCRHTAHSPVRGGGYFTQPPNQPPSAKAGAPAGRARSWHAPQPAGPPHASSLGRAGEGAHEARASGGACRACCAGMRRPGRAGAAPLAVAHAPLLASRVIEASLPRVCSLAPTPAGSLPGARVPTQLLQLAVARRPHTSAATSLGSPSLRNGMGLNASATDPPPSHGAHGHSGAEPPHAQQLRRSTTVVSEPSAPSAQGAVVLLSAWAAGGSAGLGAHSGPFTRGLVLDSAMGPVFRSSPVVERGSSARLGALVRGSPVRAPLGWCLVTGTVALPGAMWGPFCNGCRVCFPAVQARSGGAGGDAGTAPSPASPGFAAQHAHAASSALRFPAAAATRQRPETSPARMGGAALGQPTELAEPQLGYRALKSIPQAAMQARPVLAQGGLGTRAHGAVSPLPCAASVWQRDGRAGGLSSSPGTGAFALLSMPHASSPARGAAGVQGTAQS